MGHSNLGLGTRLNRECIERVERIFRAKVIGHNLKFDLSFLYYHYGIDEVTPYGGYEWFEGLGLPKIPSG